MTDKAKETTWVVATLLLFAALLGTAFGESSYRVVGSSMEPTLKHGDFVRVEPGYFSGRTLERGALIAIKLKTRPGPFVKRIVAIAGDEVLVRDGGIVVDGQSYNLPEGGASILVKQLFRYGNHVPEGHFIALGDNPSASLDSAVFGILSQRQIMGRVQPVKP